MSLLGRRGDTEPLYHSNVYRGQRVCMRQQEREREMFLVKGHTVGEII